MKKFYYIFCVVFAAMLGKVIAQPFDNNISGIVLDKKTGGTIPNVNIYISNTTWGTTSNIDGSFKISSIIPANHEIVFSMVGYESQSKICKLSDSSKIFIKIEMVPKVYEIKEVTVMANRPTQWFDDLEVFERKFLGYSPYSINCKIINSHFINFEHPFQGALIAESEYPIEILNYDLGYKISCELNEFKFDETNHKLNYTYRLFYTEIDTNDVELREKWASTREKKYKESLAYFVRSLIAGNFRKAGFELTLVYKPGREGLDILDPKKIIIKENKSNTFKIEFKDYLRVINYNIVDQNIQASYIRLNYPSIALDEFGYPLEKNAMTLIGYWSELGVASFLPKYYGFEKSRLNVN